MRTEEIAPYAPAVIKLLRDVLYHDDTVPWDLLLTHLTPVRAYFGTIGLEVYVSEADGFAYVWQPELEDADGQRMALPRLTRRDRLSYQVTVLCVLLRERLDQFDASAPDSDRLILTLEDLRELARPFFADRNDERALFRKIDATVERVVDLGFLKRLGGTDEDRYEVRRVLKAKLDSGRLAEIKERLRGYVPMDAERPDAE